MNQPLTSEIVKHNFYVDDCLFSCESETETINLVQNLVKMLSKVGFRLKTWLSNRKRVLEAIPESGRAKDLGCHEFESSLATRVLGVSSNQANLKQSLTNFISSLKLHCVVMAAAVTCEW